MILLQENTEAEQLGQQFQTKQVRKSGVPDLYPCHMSSSFVGRGNDMGTFAPADKLNRLDTCWKRMIKAKTASCSLEQSVTHTHTHTFDVMTPASASVHSSVNFVLST